MLLLMSCVFGQDLQNAVWHFGNHAGLNFNTPYTTSLPLPDIGFNPLEGCASISDDNGNLLFFTDGVTVWRFWNDEYEIIASGLMGHSSSTQNAIIVHKPNNPNSYYIVTIGGETSDYKGLHYSEINLANGPGTLVSLNTPLKDHLGIQINTAYHNTSEALTLTKHANGTDYWVVAYISKPGNISDYVYSYKVTEQGIISNSPSSSNILNNSVFFNSSYTLKIAPNNSKIAIAGTGLHVGSFNSASGNISMNNNAIGNSEGTLVYGCEFSPNSNNIYYSIYDSPIELPTSLWGVSLSNPYNAFPLSGSNDILGLQLGIDNKIYCAELLAQSLSVICNPNNVNSPQFQYQSLSLGSTVGGFGFPQLVHRYGIPENPCGQITGIYHNISTNSFEWFNNAETYIIEVISDSKCSVKKDRESSIPTFGTTTTNNNFISVNELMSLVNYQQEFMWRIKTNCGEWTDWCCFDNDAQAPYIYPHIYENGSCFYGNQPCNSEYNLSITVTVPSGNTVVEQASNILTAQNIVSTSANADYHAGEAVFLNPGFQAQYGSVFLAHIEACTNAQGKPAQQATERYSVEVSEENVVKNEANKNYVIIAPNPSSTFVNISVENLKMQNITVTSIDGRTMFTNNEGNIDIYKVDISNYIQGIYLVTVNTVEGNIVTGKIIKN